MILLKNIIENWVYLGKMPKKMTPYMVDVLIEVYNKLARGEKAEFIASEVNDLLLKCGIKTQPCGIGWVAYR